MDDSGLRSRLAAAEGAGAGDETEQVQPDDDWLAEVGEADWDESAAQRARRRTATPAYRGLADRGDDARWPMPTSGVADRDPRSEAADAHRALIERRRLVAAFVLCIVVGAAIVLALLLFRGGGEETTSTEPVVETSPTTTVPTTTPSATTTAPTTTTPTTTETPPPSSTAAFVLPGNEPLRPGSEDTATVTSLQESLTSLGYDPGPVDGIYGPLTTAGVVAFQQANGLSPDGTAGPLTAAALNEALAAQEGASG